MSKKPLTISLVIPVYNEESHLENCLRSVVAQGVPFDEIIVVDNNSSDGTVQIAQTFPGVRVVHERRQGVIYARTMGFNTAKSDLIARIDADTVLPQDWSLNLQKIFADKNIHAVTGRMEYNDMAATDVCNRIDLFFRRYLARNLRETALQAANMAMRREAWHAVRHELCGAKGQHEDLCLGIHMYEKGLNVVFDERLVASIGFRQAESSYRTFCSYVWLNPKTYRLHKLKSRYYIYPVVFLAIAFYLPLKALHRGFDADTGKFSLQKLFTPGDEWRVNPATFVE